jgi:hypothetical protein
MVSDRYVAQSDKAVLVFATRTKTKYASGLTVGEAISFKDIVENVYYTDTYADRMQRSSGKKATVKVHVAWDESDYQIDVGPAADAFLKGITKVPLPEDYIRILARAKDWGVDGVVYEPQNTLHARRQDSSDDWGWEAGLWFGMGEKLHRGEWDPRIHDVPTDILATVKYAREVHRVGLMAYIYPCILNATANFSRHSYQSLDLSDPAQERWLTEVLVAFLKKTGAAGFSWDHDVFSDKKNNERTYSQYVAWMRITSKLREVKPDIIMDHRQLADVYGPFWQLAGSYDEPLGSDENPETFGVHGSPSLHTDHVYADQVRRVNAMYVTQQLVPAIRLPGFMFHQVQRNDANGTPCQGTTKDCYNLNTRTFDYMGYEYSVLSNVASAGLNTVMASIPARDVGEDAAVGHGPDAPSKVSVFVQKWMRWTDENGEYLRNAGVILPNATVPDNAVLSADPTQANFGVLDGWHAAHSEKVSGYVFLFNPSFTPRNLTLRVGEQIGFGLRPRQQRRSINDLRGGKHFVVQTIYPERAYTSTGIETDSTFVVTIGGQQAVVLYVEEKGATTFEKQLQPFSRRPDLEVKASACDGVTPSVSRGMAVSTTGLEPTADGWVNTTLCIPTALREQLNHRRTQEYPVNWTDKDRASAWLDPARLLVSIYISNPTIAVPPRTALLDGRPLEVKLATHSPNTPYARDPSRGQGTFLGWFLDVSEVEAERVHDFRVKLPAGFQGYQGLFFDNVKGAGNSGIVRSASMITTNARDNEVLFV